MSQGLFTAISGITANQSRIDVISDNIANMNTTGFKASQVNFENVFLKTLSSGTAPTSNVGGSNPVQIGLGTTVGEIVRNFANGSVQTTNNANDLYINGNGFFTLTDSEGSLVLSRAGNFRVDSQGYLTSPKGLKVLGTSDINSTTGSTTPIKIPQSLSITESTATSTGAELLSNTANATINDGTFTLTVNGTDHEFTIDADSTLDSVATDINTAATGVTASVASGKLRLSYNNTVVTSFGMSATSDTSNFLAATQLATATPTTAGTTVTYDSMALTANSVTIRPDDGTSSTTTYKSYSVGADGAITAYYSNGCQITVTGDASRELLYSTTSGYQVRGDGVTVVANAVKPQELQLQMTKVTNSAGLIAENGNRFTIGPNAGYATFGIGDSGGMGSLVSGSLESSNVDLTSEFANMIVAQRGIDANGRTFDAQNQILRTIVNIGR
ncbi:MAG: hypothetical protein A2287_09635 [Candidatus Melainabacteria bacterium RIFOXYA12_FULL_32_12]|nr:MAG: hypothetical protein A2255_02855 [Candidatus Melainabacteria bacterium RIFOXYA2_FULL_32_9]OGI25747.1 MAG: hypothetical protein A2287_09635 [Candidatus Melainabacteria bacterium RIFOXYA12_FULL_32_12]